MERTKVFRLQIWFLLFLFLGTVCFIVLPGWIIVDQVRSGEMLSGRGWLMVVFLLMGVAVLLSMARSPIAIKVKPSSISLLALLGVTEIPWVGVTELSRGGTADRIITIRHGQRRTDILTNLFVRGENLQGMLLNHLREPELRLPLRWRPMLTPQGRMSIWFMPLALMTVGVLFSPANHPVFLAMGVVLLAGLVWILIQGFAEIEITQSSISRKVFPGFIRTIKWEHVYEVSTHDSGEEGAMDVELLLIAGKGGKITLRSTLTPQYAQVRYFICSQVDSWIRPRKPSARC
jgi:hypothetical protein